MPQHVLDLNVLAGRDWLTDVGDLLACDGWRAQVQRLVNAAESNIRLGGLDGASAFLRSLPDLTMCAPVLRPTKVIGVGLNHRSFVEGIGQQIPLHPELFHKTSSALIGSGTSIQVPAASRQVVPEGEVAVIIGRAGHDIPEEQAAAHIAGLTCANDLSARDLEFRTTQWSSGKMFPTSCPLGPYLVTTDEFPDLDDLRLSTLLNGQIIQSGSTSDLVFGLSSLISRISQLTQLEIGDVILTGTPSDLGAVSDPVFLREGDVVEVHVEGLGTLRNPVEDRADQATRSVRLPDTSDHSAQDAHAM
ncbi:fumarylacetoacetate hydrolase family protein [Kineosporia sp. NBRC 101731]|uniref:fumarylacetoacetate hydrolase family protein n=1 Tax=Kineosporia sp. NBRC 101731 TaxID=3032199 RepID=UPI0025567B42|nr:fumarylacetoacetate hydrolase family protein [Kineosporia sp. NBRC 101731]